MKKQILFLMIAMLSATAYADDTEYEGQWADWVIDWSQKYNDSGLAMICDDSYFKGVVITVPGREHYDFHAEVQGGLDCRAQSVKVIKTPSGLSTRIELLNEAECTVQIEQLDGKGKRTGKTARLDMSPEC